MRSYLFSILFFLFLNAGFSQTKISTVDGGTLTGCTGTLTDSDDNAGNYLDNEDYSVTISPANAQKVVLEFISFDVEADVACNLDYLIIYDGPDALSPIIGTYCNTIPPPAIITSTGSSLHIVWHSNGSNNFTGFEMNWQGKINGLISISNSISCNGASDGTLTASGSWGTAPYSYLWDDGLSQNTSVASNLVADIYTVTITDVNGCDFTLAKTLDEPSLLSAILNKTNASCNGTSDGSISISSPSGGSGAYEYTINGGTSWEGTGSYTLLSASTYDVRIRDANNIGCVITLNAAYTITQPDLLTAAVNPINVTACNGNANASIEITGSTGGSSFYEYTINGGTIWQSGNLFTGLVAGTYNVKMRDANAPTCVVTLNGALTLTQPTALNATLSSTNLICYNTPEGEISITVPTGGSGSYEYSHNGGTSWQGTGTFSNLSAGYYNVVFRDAVNTSCTLTLNNALQLTQPNILNATINTTDVSVCYGNNNGAISLTIPTGGSGNYEYSINGGAGWQASDVFNTLTTGTYDIYIRDANATSCSIQLNSALFISEPVELSAILNKTNASCNGTSDGSISISSPSGGSGAYEYTINGGTSWEGTGSYTLLPASTYDVRIRDANNIGCVITLNAAYTITQPDLLTAAVNPINVTACNGNANASIEITGSTGGSSFYEYTINGGTIWQSGNLFTGLVAGTYNVKMRDANAPTCVVTLNGALTLTQPTALNATLSSTNLICYNTPEGEINITVPTGGSGSYEYSNNGGTSWQGTGTFSNLSAGYYNVVFRDAVNTSCTLTLNNALQLTQPNILNATINTTDVSVCYGNNNGAISLTIPTGGSGNYEYSINGGAGWQASDVFNTLTTGTYDIYIRDANATSCSIQLNSALFISEPVELSAILNKTNASCNGTSDGSISISSPSGGSGAYEYTINGGTSWEGTGSYTLLSASTYDVRIRDANNIGCVITLNAAYTITQPDLLTAAVNPINVTACNGNANASIEITGSTGGSSFYEYTINGGTIWQSGNLFTGLVAGTYNVKMRDANAPTCVVTLNGALTLTQPTALNATLSSTNLICYNTPEGEINITVPTGGSGSYEYSNNGGTSWQGTGTFSNLSAGYYNVVFRDAVNTSCTLTLNNALQLTQPNILNATINTTDVSVCYGNNNGAISLTIPTGGSGNYEYSINGGAGWQATDVFNTLTTGTYDIYIRDANA